MTDGKPDWLRIRAPTGDGFGRVRELSRSCGLRTVCDASHCPNMSDCWSRGHATFLIMGPSCTRGCAFCAVDHGRPLPLDPSEPERVARAIKALGLRHAVITSVTRDDLDDQGAGHFARTVGAVHGESPGTRVELLVPDMGASAEDIGTVLRSAPDVVGHNVETVRRLQPLARDRRSGYRTSLETLKVVKGLSPSTPTKSSIMLGLGEREEEVLETLADLREAGVDAVTIGQYLRPKGGRLEVAEYVRPEVFERLGEEALAMGFRHVSSAPLVRSSFNAHDFFVSREENHAYRRL